jgi:hypothetical protein
MILRLRDAISDSAQLTALTFLPAAAAQESQRDGSPPKTRYRKALELKIRAAALREALLAQGLCLGRELGNAIPERAELRPQLNDGSRADVCVSVGSILDRED